MSSRDTSISELEKPYQKVLRIDELLSSGGHFTIDELSTKMGIDSRSVFRYLDRLQASGRQVSAQFRTGRTKEYWIPTEISSPPQELIQALQKMDQAMTEGGVRKYHKILTQVIQHLNPLPKPDLSIPAGLNKFGNEIEPFFHLDHGPLAEHNKSDSLTAQTMDKILGAIQNQNCLKIQYAKSGQKKTETILFEPYFLSLRVGKLYLVGTYSGESRLVSLVFKRFKMISVESQTFKRNTRANLQDFYKHCFGQWVPREDAKKIDITLKIEEAWLLDIFQESNFNPSVTIEAAETSTIVKLCLYDTPDLESWLFSLHPHARVISPRSLRERLRIRADAVAKQLA